MRFLLFSNGRHVINLDTDNAAFDLSALLGLKLTTVAGLLNTAIKEGETKTFSVDGKDYLLRFKVD